ncbi:hypothetical protein [Paraburkholderia phenoliruptrix]|uniref:hypothetical protein n=1 Tax=Paraburkholderia phenoliruptrix TaxID=252970 RepID=UPI002869C898|nr:hypothetical protein [Paraburkholderia phenoliruptrix]WMY08675.1 hypothetical protein P3F88_02535 [Paraburkholderia phenoliruptrix]
MPVGISALAHTVRAQSNGLPVLLKLGHAQQLVAAALGYKSLAAYQASTEESAFLDAAAHAVLDDELLLERAEQLGLTPLQPYLPHLLKSAFEQHLPGLAVHQSHDALEDAVRDIVDATVLNHGETISAMTVTNNDGIREVYLPVDFEMDALPSPDDFLEIPIEGHVTMKPDIERPYVGHRIDVQATLMLARVGRVCIAAPVVHVESAQLDYDW